jgi:hypothetical protein
VNLFTLLLSPSTEEPSKLPATFQFIMPLPLQIEAPPGQFPPALGAKPPRKTQDDRLVEPEQLGLKCLYEPPKTSAGKTTGVDVEYAIYSYSFVID